MGRGTAAHKKRGRLDPQNRVAQTGQEVSRSHTQNPEATYCHHEACKVPDLRMMSQLSQLESELQEPEISLWCRT